MDITIKKKEDNQMVFVIEGINVPFINAIRRICTVEVPTIAIETVEIIKNDAKIFDEALAHRMGLIPLTTDLESMVPASECDCEDHCPRCSVSLLLKEKGPKTVYSKDLKSQDPQVKPVFDTIPILKLKEGEEVELEAIAQLGIGLEHAKWQPTTSCAYKYYPKITIDKEKCEECAKCADACPRGILEFDEKKNEVKILDIENCSTCKTCVNTCESGAITVESEEGKFIFRIETDGSLSPEEILTRACDILSEKSDKIIEFCES
ncbi:DNA-directed RNA polymerase subunit D [Methanobacterium congolense]|jgi:DNA-directed RNA polymerase subunit D|uniref:DNA-directed RNA polymerase subunit Rpo3 n=1 Tax=Methanobacterium congolense TaxID=118062 RepID=A0A1D3L2W9_9EURY|nr:DNA-directed RNA polymerase subunit D [Methanobacterium congolense]SCG85905.1 DNA-directed RNA polymerase subunit D [Methanobacterium congolense]